ncbi:hypothetical protein PF010_g6844 [Phytophthora fragariae]|uniref:Uncharacterized protein n=1 Tax=Phytophthora fragariae TaxID=53985 RepID=A0A6G0LKI4_9STRA|nr:hypothetical protein PF010_g6844 [Phytophthora fragariae]
MPANFISASLVALRFHIHTCQSQPDHFIKLLSLVFRPACTSVKTSLPERLCQQQKVNCTLSTTLLGRVAAAIPSSYSSALPITALCYR